MKPIFQDSSARVKQLSDFLKKQQENKKFMRRFEIGVTFLLISFFLFFAIKPTAQTISSLVGEIKSKEITNTQMKEKINDLMIAQEAYSLAQGRYQIIESSLPSRPNFYQAFNQIKETLDGSGTSYNAGSFDLAKIDDKSESDPNIKTYSISLNIKNPFTNSLKIITGLLNNRRLINISEISFRNDTNDNKEANSQNTLITNFIATFFYWQK
jgi:hypothetical protein